MHITKYTYQNRLPEIIKELQFVVNELNISVSYIADELSSIPVICFGGALHVDVEFLNNILNNIFKIKDIKKLITLNEWLNNKYGFYKTYPLYLPKAINLYSDTYSIKIDNDINEISNIDSFSPFGNIGSLGHRKMGFKKIIEKRHKRQGKSNDTFK